MYLSFGHRPEFKSVHGSPYRPRRPRARIVVIALAAVASVALAQNSTPLTLAEAGRLATEAEPGQRAIEARADALEQQAEIAGLLPDPVLRLGLNNFPIESGGFSTEGMTNAAIGLRQEFPAAGTRSLRSRQYRSLSGEMSAAADARARDVRLATRNAWLDLHYLQHAHALVLETRPFFAELAGITRSLYAVGRRSQQDVLRAELELSRLDDRLVDIERRRSGARAALAQWIGASAARPVASGLPPWNEIPTRVALEAALQAHPLLQAADARIEAQSAAVGVAEKRSKPGWAVELGYSYREGTLADGMPRSDFVSVNVSVDLPYFRRTAIDSTLMAALREETAAESDRLQIARRLQRQLATEYSRWHELSRRLDIYSKRILSQAAAQAAASLNAYQSDQGDFADVMRAYIDDLNTRIDHIDLQVQQARSYAVLASLGGFEQ